MGKGKEAIIIISLKEKAARKSRLCFLETAIELCTYWKYHNFD